MNEGSLQIKRRNAFSKEAVPHTRAGDCGIYSGRRQKKKKLEMLIFVLKW